MNNNNMDFAFFSANLHHFVPSIPWEDHRYLFLTYKKYHSARNPAEYTAEILGLQPNMPAGILAVFHLGQHELLPLFLADAGLDFDILISKKVYWKYETSLNRHRTLFGQADRQFNFLFAEDQRVILQIRSSLRAGRHILVFADGNLGTADAESTLLPVSFFESTLSVRQGIGFISHVLQVPVYPVFDQLSDDLVRISLQPPICPDPEVARHVYIRDCMQLLFAQLSDRLNQQWTDWACWEYLHHNGMLCLRTAMAPPPGKVDIRHVSLFKLETKLFLLDRRDYNIFVVNDYNCVNK
ncbi:hypothetical protein [Sphingobacterium thalpophilum]|uniref:hypothetical protein n=1 Tax=Sphingobacterium thalpophilum TaxID=259 RepID=UPI003C731060